MEITNWVLEKLKSGYEIIIPEIADYELRREYILNRERMARSLARLDELGRHFRYLPITTEMMRLAADLWAAVRKPPNPQPTADRLALDGDAILAAQAKIAGAVIITNNIGHLSRFDGVVAKLWREEM
jgi:predicted nucleic acid-binding protein